MDSLTEQHFLSFLPAEIVRHIDGYLLAIYLEEHRSVFDVKIPVFYNDVMYALGEAPVSSGMYRVATWSSLETSIVTNYFALQEKALFYTAMILEELDIENIEQVNDYIEQVNEWELERHTSFDPFLKMIFETHIKPMIAN